MQHVLIDIPRSFHRLHSRGRDHRAILATLTKQFGSVLEYHVEQKRHVGKQGMFITGSCVVEAVAFPIAATVNPFDPVAQLAERVRYLHEAAGVEYLNSMELLRNH